MTGSFAIRTRWPQTAMGFMTLQALVYRLKDGQIDGISFSQITTK